MSLSEEFAKLFPQPSPELLARLAALDGLPDALGALSARLDVLVRGLEGAIDGIDADLDALTYRVDVLTARVTALEAGTPPVPPTTQPSGFALPTANLPGFTLRYIEDFDRPCTEGPVNDTGAKAPFDLLYGVEAHNDLPGGTPITIGTYPSPWDDTSNRGHYGASILSVAPGSSVLRERIRTENGWPRVSAFYPRVGPTIGSPYGTRDVLGGAFELVWRADVVNGYKFVPLLWPRSDHRTTATGVGADGEIDWVEANMFGGALIAGYIHWQGDVNTDSTTEQTRVSTATPLAGSGWHKTRTEWINAKPSPLHPTRSIGGSVSLWLDDVHLKTIVGSTDGVTGPFIPMNPMHWVIQQETMIGGGAIDTTAGGFLDIDWMAYYSLDSSPA